MTYRSPTKSYHHLDHFFGSNLFVDNMVGYEIMGVDNATLSDHSPVVLSLDSLNLSFLCYVYIPFGEIRAKKA